MFLHRTALQMMTIPRLGLQLGDFNLGMRLTDLLMRLKGCLFLVQNLGEACLSEEGLDNFAFPVVMSFSH